MPAINGVSMTLVGLDKFKKDAVLEEVSHVADEKGEFTEVQVLEEFDPDQFLDQLEQHQPQCPRCLELMKFGRVQYPDWFSPIIYCWFSHDVTKFQTSELLILLRFYFHDV